MFLRLFIRFVHLYIARRVASNIRVVVEERWRCWAAAPVDGRNNLCREKKKKKNKPYSVSRLALDAIFSLTRTRSFAFRTRFFLNGNNKYERWKRKLKRESRRERNFWSSSFLFKRIESHGRWLFYIDGVWVFSD